MVMALAAALTGGGAVVYHKLFEWKRFAVVEPGVLYRSGMLKDWQLEAAIEKYGIKTVYSLTYTHHDKERELCERRGVRRHFHYLPGDGVGPDDPYLRFLEIVRDPANHPVLVHCSAGVQRTGGASALYRVLIQGWELDAAIEEMIAMGNEGKSAQIDQIKRIVERIEPRSASASRAAR